MVDVLHVDTPAIDGRAIRGRHSTFSGQHRYGHRFFFDKDSTRAYVSINNSVEPVVVVS